MTRHRRNPVEIAVGVLEARAVVVSAGSNHALALTADGKIEAWGSNNEGQITVPAGPFLVK